MHYISTRGKAESLPFEEAVLAGLASDGGLYVPERIPAFEPHELIALQSADYARLALAVIRPFVAGAFDDRELEAMIARAYAPFRHRAVAPLKQLSSDHFLLELFHGPTLAFKDFALQFLGHLLDAILARKEKRIVIVGATSGDTGSAAIAGCAGRAHIDTFILYPEGRVSEVQRRQMTGIADPKVHAIAVQGTFDDCQHIVKALFADPSFRARHALVAVNSINWARILAQVVYYFYAALRLGAPAREVSFSVPTGNFGDIFAGYIAKRMGLPIRRLIIATNRNDILARCLDTGVYGMEGVTPTLSPSMDIQVSSNFERLLFDLYGRDKDKVAALMEALRRDKRFALSPGAHAALKKEFSAYTVNDAETTGTIARIYAETGEILDPHTAVGAAAAEHYLAQSETREPVVTLSTAHPAKFPDAVKKAVGIHPALPEHMKDLFERKERIVSLPNDAEAVKRFIEMHCHA